MAMPDAAILEKIGAQQMVDHLSPQVVSVAVMDGHFARVGRRD
jgi:hypothetical protein